MPRQRSEASNYLSLYKLTVEKKRLQRERVLLDQRCQQIDTRLSELNAQIQQLERSTQQLRQPQTQSPWPTSNVYSPGDQTPLANDLDTPPDTMLLEY
ncbi:MAG: hypothetical protein ACTS3T_19710 [Almyronema sp.]